MFHSLSPIVNESHVYVAYVVVRSQQGKEKVSEEIVVVPSKNGIESIMNDPKKNKQKKSEMGGKQSVPRSLGCKVSLV